MGSFKREITATIGIIITAFILFFLPEIFFQSLVFIVIILTSLEISHLFSRDFFLFKIFIPLSSACWVMFYFFLDYFIKYIFPLLFIIPLFLILFKNPDSKDRIIQIFSAISIPIFIGYFGGSLVFLRIMDGTKSGLVYVIYLLTMVWISDSAAYYVGRNFGKRRISPHISPNKTVEGTFALIISAIILTLIFFGFSIISALLGLGMGLSSFFGDLFQSYFKRTLEIKDSGKFFPGHGGFWDRTDSLFFSSYIFYLIKSL